MTDTQSKQMWTEKYRPKTLKEILGSPKNVSIIREWCDSFKGGAKPSFPALLLIGAPGIGKTSAAHAMGNDYMWPIAEFNASDIRTYDSLMEEVAPLVLTKTLKAGIFRKLILLDEVDSLYDVEGKVSKTAPDAIIKILNATKHPIVMTCNEDFNVHPKIKDMCILIKWRRMSEGTIRKTLLNILKQENMNFDIEDVNKSNDNIRDIDVKIIDDGNTSYYSFEYESTNSYYTETYELQELILKIELLM